MILNISLLLIILLTKKFLNILFQGNFLLAFTVGELLIFTGIIRFHCISCYHSGG